MVLSTVCVIGMTGVGTLGSVVREASTGDGI